MHVTIDRFRKAAESQDLDALTRLMASDVRFVSPVKFAPMQGVPMVRALLAVLLRTFEDFRYVGALRGEAENGSGGTMSDAYVLIFRAEVNGAQIHGIDLLQLDDRGLISDFTVMVRPLTALTALSEAVYAGLMADGHVLD